MPVFDPVAEAEAQSQPKPKMQVDEALSYLDKVSAHAREPVATEVA